MMKDDTTARDFLITELKWDRIWLNIWIKQDGISDEAVSFYLEDEKNNIIIEPECKRDGDLYKLSLNITNTGNMSAVAKGRYLLYASTDTGKIKCPADKKIINSIGDNKKSFIYSDGSKSCDIELLPDDSDNIIISVSYTDNSSMRAKAVYAIKSLSAAVFKRIYKNNRKKYINNRKRRTILILHETKNGVNTNLDAFKAALYDNGRDAEFAIEESYWGSDESGASLIRHMINEIKKLSRADFIFLEEEVSILNWLRVDSDVIVTQLWHAGIGFKAAGYSRWGHTSSPAPFSCGRQYTYGVCCSNKNRRVFAEVWGINPSMVLPAGMPRIDVFLDDNNKKKITTELYEKYPILNNKKIILFAPTFRGKNKKDAYYPKDKIDLERLHKLCGDRYIIIFKLHPIIKDRLFIEEKYRDRLIDFSDYPNINNLLYITDILITDYSSCIFEYSLLGRPMIFYAFDEKEYSSERGFHLDYEKSAPGRVVHTMDELIAAVENEEFDIEKVQTYVERNFDNTDTHASERIIEWIIYGRVPDKIINQEG